MPRARTFLSFGGRRPAPAPAPAHTAASLGLTSPGARPDASASEAGRRPARHAAGPPPGTVLLVCTGNICRSAYGGHALQHRLDALAPGRVEVASMGSMPNQALTVPAPILALAAARGVTGLEEHTPQPLVGAAVRAADLVLAAARTHMEAALHEEPAATGRTFTVFELARLVRALDARTEGSWITPGMGVRAFAREASRHRVLARGSGEGLDLPDPFGGPEEGYTAMVEAMDPALDVIGGALTRAVAGGR